MHKKLFSDVTDPGDKYAKTEVLQIDWYSVQLLYCYVLISNLVFVF